MIQLTTSLSSSKLDSLSGEYRAGFEELEFTSAVKGS